MASPTIRYKINEKDIFEPTVGTTYTIYQGNGSDTATVRYLNMSTNSTNKIAILPDAEILILSFDNEVLDYPIKIYKDNTKYIDKRTVSSFSSFQLYTLVANTRIRIIGVGY